MLIGDSVHCCEVKGDEFFPEEAKDAMTYDCFTFFNELDVLEIRLNVLKDVVDKFVLVEAGETHTGHPKPFYFHENRSRFAAFADKIIYRRIDRFPPGHGAWWNENYQRNVLTEVLLKAGAKDDDDILISDLDEIPRPEKVREYKGTGGIKAFRQTFYSYYLNYEDVHTRGTYTTKMMPCRDFLHAFDGVETYANEFLPDDINRGTTPTKIRRRTLPRSRGGEIRIYDGGWHFTCIGGAKAMLAKMRAVAPHHDFDPEDKTLTEEKLAALIAAGGGPALKMDCFAVPVDDSFPAYIRENQSRYASLIFEVTPEYLRRVRWRRLFRGIEGRLRQFAERVCPPALHNRLHLIKMALLRDRR